MNPSLFILLTALTLGTGLGPAAAQDAKPAPKVVPAARQRLIEVPLPPGSEPKPVDTLLGANYRIVISAAAKDKPTGELSVQTCSAAFQIHGCIAQPTADNPIGTDLTLRGDLSELEGGRLRLGYSLAVTTRVPSQTFGMPGSGQAVVANHSYKKNGATGMLLLQPWRSYELMQISGVLYSLSITPMETWPAAKHAAPTTGDAPKKAAAEPGEKKPENAAPRRGPSDEDRKRYESLSDRGREKFRDAIREAYSQEQFRNAPVEERRERTKNIFDQIEAEDRAELK